MSDQTTHRVVYPDGSAFVVDLEKIYALDARKVEIPAVTAMTATELMRAMEEGYGLAGRLQSKVLLETSRVGDALARRRAELLLDIIPAKLKDKGLSTTRSPGGSEDLRNAVIDADETHGKLRDAQGQLEALQVLLKVHMRGFEMAFSAVKRASDARTPLTNLPPGTTDVNDHVTRTPGFQQPKLDVPGIDEEYGVPIGNAARF